MLSQLKHRYTLGAGLTMLVLAMALLMIRNYYAVKIEMIIAVRRYGSTIGEPGRLRVINREFGDKWALAGSALTVAGMLLLLFRGLDDFGVVYSAPANHRTCSLMLVNPYSRS